MSTSPNLQNLSSFVGRNQRLFAKEGAPNKLKTCFCTTKSSARSQISKSTGLMVSSFRSRAVLSRRKPSVVLISLSETVIKVSNHPLLSKHTSPPDVDHHIVVRSLRQVTACPLSSVSWSRFASIIDSYYTLSCLCLLREYRVSANVYYVGSLQ